jgi:signal transduction histidine kinase
MKAFRTISLLLLLPFASKGQDTTINVTPGMLHPVEKIIRLGDIYGWLFKTGNDSTWAKKYLNTTGWKKMRPSELLTQMPDKNGKLECWFRIKFRLDTSFGNMSLYLVTAVWGATDVYVDEELLASFGNTGARGNPFKEYDRQGGLAVPLGAKNGIEHVLAIHFVDFLSPLPPYHLKSENNIHEFTLLVPHESQVGYVKYLVLYNSYRSVWLVINVILCLLFWFLAFQNRNEKNLLFIASTCTIILLYFYCSTYRVVVGGSYISNRLADLAAPMLIPTNLLFIMILMARIFKRKFNFLFKGLAVLMFVCGAFSYVFIGPLLVTLEVALAAFVCCYYIVISWKDLEGAQWALVTGFFIAVIFALFAALRGYIRFHLNPSADLLISSGMSLSIPLSLLVYVAIRFKEIITEVRSSAKQVVQLSEEKKQQALNQQKVLQEEVNRQTAELRSTLENLKATQSQLVQSEKMASLGELTAGIAHEIQNPLNFVNNFSDVNTELIDEAEQELAKGNVKEAKSILSDIRENEQKINHHGKRADAIVKGMLQHSRSGSGQKELTDINKLADEYLRLAYHGLRAKDKTFNAEIKTDFDNSISKINIVPQDIGRVILNLINNAFYAVNEKQKANLNGYEPTVSVTTTKLDGKVVIKIKDNGEGIPQKNLDKIFQPFFTTKPTGQGTGLGLSLAYDIIKAHGGEIKVETKEGEGSEFVIQLPITSNIS